MSENLFETAVREKIRFTTNRGVLSVEELWDLSLNSLDTLAKGINKQVKAEEEESFIPSAKKRKNSTPTLQLEILKHIIAVKVEEADVAKTRAEKAAKRAHLKTLMAEQVNKELSAKSVDDLQKMLAELGDDEE